MRLSHVVLISPLNILLYAPTNPRPGLEQLLLTQELRKLGECLMPLSRVREFIGVEGGPTPRDAVLLKTLVVVHEGVDWATDRPLYRLFIINTRHLACRMIQ